MNKATEREVDSDIHVQSFFWHPSVVCARTRTARALEQLKVARLKMFHVGVAKYGVVDAATKFADITRPVIRTKKFDRFRIDLPFHSSGKCLLCLPHQVCNQKIEIFQTF